MTESDHELAGRLAGEAGELLVGIRAEVGFADASALKTAGDRRSHLFLLQELTRARPGDAVLSEEGVDDAARLAADRVWIVDPLDGTREFGEEGRVDWAVHVALWERGELVAGAVALPAAGVVLGTGSKLPVLQPFSVPRLVVSRTRPPAVATQVAEAVGAALMPMGSAGAKVMAIVRSEAEVYVHAGGQYEWDSAAPVAVAQHAGLHASRLDGSALRYNSADVLLPDLVICRPELAEAVLAAID